ncbi:MAG: TolC family protein [Chryseolinea sp.]
MTRNIQKLIIVAASFACLQGHSQNLDMLSALEQSKKNYPLIKARQADVISASHDVGAATAEYIPKLTVQHQYTYGTSNSIAGSYYPNPAVISPAGGIRADNIYTATWGSYTTSMFEWNIFNFGKVAANITASKANYESAQAAYENEVFQHQIRVADAYLLALIAKKLTAIQQSNINRALHFRQVVDAGVRSGMRPGVDSALAHAEYVKAQLQLLESRRNEKSQRFQVAELTGAIPEVMTDLDSMQFFTTLPLLPDTVGISYTANPLLRVYRTRANTTIARSVAIRRTFLPSITLVGAAWARGSGISPADDSFKTSFSDGAHYQVYNYLLGVSTRWTLTDLVPIRQRYKSEKYKSVRDQELYNEQSIKVLRQQKESEMQYELLMEQAHTAPIQLSAAQRAYLQAFARYTSGMTDLPTLLQAMLALNRAEADLAVTYSNAWRALLAIAASKGSIDLFVKEINNQR